MLNGLQRIVIIVAAIVATAFLCYGHHSLAADYDVSRPILLHGVVTRLDWMNPHVRFSIAVKDQSGKVTNWEFELGSPNTLMRSGWNRSTLKIGEEITVRGCRAKDSTTQGNATSIWSHDGKLILSGSEDGQNLVAR